MVSLKTKRRRKQSERVRNVLMILVALAVVIIFFNLDLVRDGESVFSRSAENKLRFKGDLERRAYTKKERSQLISYIKRHGEAIESVTIMTTLDDSYSKVGPTSQVLHEITIVLTDGASIATPTRRIKRARLVSDILYKMKKDMKAYRGLDGKKIKSLVNTM